jgi:hypothetical protein
LLRLNALNREIAREAASDRRYQQAAKSLRRIAKTLDRNISDDQLAKFAAVNRASHGLLSDLIAAHVLAVAFAFAALSHGCRVLRAAGANRG